MTCSLISVVCLCAVLLGISLTLAGDQSTYHNLLLSAESNSSVLSTKRNRNLRQILDYIRDSSEFYPLTFSLIFSESQTTTVDFLSKYSAENSINIYVIRAENLSLKYAWKDQIDLTWIFLIDDPYTLHSAIQWEQELWNARNQYLIIFTKVIDEVSRREIFESLWRRYNVYKAILATVEDKFQCLIKYLPFDLNQGKFGGIHRVCFGKDNYNNAYNSSINYNEQDTDLRDIDKVSLIHKGDKLFEDFRDPKDYTIDVIVFASLLMNVSFDKQNHIELSSLDADIMAMLERSMKMKFRMKLLKGQSSKSDPFDRALKYIQNGTVQLILTGYFIKKYHSAYNKYEFTSAVYEDKLCFIAPAAGLVSKSYMPFLPFEKELWFLLIVYNITITVLWFFVKYLSRSFRDHKPVLLPLSSSSCLRSSNQITPSLSALFVSKDKQVDEKGVKQCWKNGASGPMALNSSQQYGGQVTTKRNNRTGLMLDPPEVHPYAMACFKLVETSCYPLQGAETAAQKAFLFGTLFFGLIVTGVYQSCLVSSLSKPFHYPELTTLEGVANSNKTIVTKYSNLKRTFTDDTSLGKRLGEKIVLVNSTRPTNDLVARTKKVIAIGRYASVKLENLSVYYDDEGNNLLHIVEECPATYTVSYATRLNSPYLEKINSILLRMQQAGFIDLWYKTMIYRLEDEEKRRSEAKRERRIKLTLEHYSLTFLLLFLGLFGCTMVFVGEMCFARRLKCSGRGKRH